MVTTETLKSVEGEESDRVSKSRAVPFEGATATFALAHSSRGAGGQRIPRPPVGGGILFLTAPFIERAAPSREPSDAAAVRGHGVADRGAAAAGRVADQERERIERSGVIQSG